MNCKPVYNNENNNENIFQTITSQICVCVYVGSEMQHWMFFWQYLLMHIYFILCFCLLLIQMS